MAHVPFQFPPIKPFGLMNSEQMRLLRDCLRLPAMLRIDPASAKLDAAHLNYDLDKVKMRPKFEGIFKKFAAEGCAKLAPTPRAESIRLMCEDIQRVILEDHVMIKGTARVNTLGRCVHTVQSPWGSETHRLIRTREGTAAYGEHLLNSLVEMANDHQMHVNIAQHIHHIAGEGLSEWERREGREEGFKRASALASEMRIAGFRVLGHGSFGIVLSHHRTPDRVYKLCANPKDAYVSYALWCREQQVDGERAHMPEIRHVFRKDNVIGYILPRYISLAEAKDLGKVPREFDAFVLQSIAAKRQPYTESLRLVYPRSLVALTADVLRFFKGAAQVDIHNGNIMFDPINNELILTDPVSESEENVL